MCGRYTLHPRSDDLAKRYNLAQAPRSVSANYNVAPGQVMPIITADKSERRQLQFMQWGFIPFWAKDPRIGYKLINARDDTIFDKPAWRSVILHKRCLVPADGFYEWRATANPKEHKQPFYIHPKNQTIFSFAGIWETWQDPSGQPRQTFSIITTTPNREMATIHDRMPVILRQADEAAWLDASTVTRSGLKPLLRPYEDNGLEIYRVSEDVNSPRHNDEHLIYALS